MNVSPDTVTISSIVGKFVGIFNDLITVVIVLALLFMFIKAGYMWMIGSSNPQNVAKAKAAITWAVIGLVLAVIARAIVQLAKDVIPTS